MQRHILTLDNIPYLIEYTYHHELFDKHTEKFVMLRKYEIINDIAQDKEILFINKNKFKEIFDESGNETFNIVYPYIKDDYESYMSSIFKWNPYFTQNSLKYDKHDINLDFYNLFKNKEELFDVRCDKVKIYRPHNRKNINSIISLSNVINNIHFNYFCERFESQQIKVGKEIKVNNNFYYEYIEFYVPSIESIFGNQKVYYNEDLNIYQIKSKDNTRPGQFKYEIHNETLVDINSLILPYSIEKINDDNDEYYIKTYYIENKESIDYLNSEYNLNNIQTTLSLIHYDNIDSESGKYLSLQGISPVSVVLSINNSFKLKAKIGFDYQNNSVISVISTFEYPKIYNDDGDLMSVQDSYFYFNKVNSEDQQAYWNFNEYDIESEILLENLSEELIETLKFNSSGYAIEMSLDNKFSQVFYRRSIAANEIDDFTFAINGIFVDWKEYPEIIFVRTMFIDKPLSKIFFSNLMILTKEQFKYCINDSNSFRINLKNDNNDMIFIDKIQCSIKKYTNDKDININSNFGGYNKIVYKTVFYKVNDLQSIKLRDGVVQNVGINLSDYMSKVNDFKLKLDGYEFVESGRNNIYVIFTIPTNQIVNKNGKYDIVVAETDEYISSGNYIIS